MKISIALVCLILSAILFLLLAAGPDDRPGSRRARTPVGVLLLRGGPFAVVSPTIVDLTATVPNFTAGRQGNAIIAIVDHIMQGTLVGTDSWFENKAADVSAHYGVGKLGEIHKYVKDQDTAWHAGVIFRPSAALVLARPTVNPNLYTIGIEHEGFSGDPMPEAQFQATLWLHIQLKVAFNLVIDADHILAHSTINADHAGCPGPTFPWDRLFGSMLGSDGV